MSPTLSSRNKSSKKKSSTMQSSTKQSSTKKSSTKKSSTKKSLTKQSSQMGGNSNLTETNLVIPKSPYRARLRSTATSTRRNSTIQKAQPVTIKSAPKRPIRRTAKKSLSTPSSEPAKRARRSTNISSTTDEMLATMQAKQENFVLDEEDEKNRSTAASECSSKIRVKSEYVGNASDTKPIFTREAIVRIEPITITESIDATKQPLPNSSDSIDPESSDSHFNKPTTAQKTESPKTPVRWNSIPVMSSYRTPDSNIIEAPINKMLLSSGKSSIQERPSKFIGASSSNLDMGVTKISNLQKYSESLPELSIEQTRMCLNPNTRLGTLYSILKKYCSPENAGLKQDGVDNVTTEPIVSNASKRLSELDSSTSQQVMKRQSLSPNTKVVSIDQIEMEVSLQSNEELTHLDIDQEANEISKAFSEIAFCIPEKSQSIRPHINRVTKVEVEAGPQLTANDPNFVHLNCDKDNREEPSSLDNQPNKSASFKRLSMPTTITKKDAKRFSLNPNARLNASELGPIGSGVMVQSVACDQQIDEQRAQPSTKQSKMQIQASFVDSQANCSRILQESNEEKRQEKSKKKLQLQDSKYQKKKEKRAAKLQQRKEKEAREIEADELVTKECQLKREVKLKMAELIEQERATAIEKALKFSELIKAEKGQRFPAEPLDSSTEEPVVNKRRRQPNSLQISVVQRVRSKNVSFEDDLPATMTMRREKQIQKKETTRKTQKTSAGSFVVEMLPEINENEVI